MSSHRLKSIGFWAYPAVVLAVWLAASAFTLSQLTTVIPSLSAQGSVRPATEKVEQPVTQACLVRC